MASAWWRAVVSISLFMSLMCDKVDAQAGNGRLLDQVLIESPEPIETITGTDVGKFKDKAYHRIYGRNARATFECGNTQAGDSVQVYNLNVTGEVHEMTVICTKPVFVYKKTRVGWIFPEVRLFAAELGYFENVYDREPDPRAMSFDPDNGGLLTFFSSMGGIASGLGTAMKYTMSWLVKGLGGGPDLTGFLSALKNMLTNVKNYVNTNTKALRSINEWQGTIRDALSVKDQQIKELNDGRIQTNKAIEQLARAQTNANAAVIMLKNQVLGQFKVQDQKLVAVVDLVDQLGAEVDLGNTALWNKMKELSVALSSGLESLRDTTQAGFNRLVDTDRRLARGIRDSANLALDLHYNIQMRRDLTLLYQGLKKNMSQHVPAFVPFTAYPGEDSLVSAQFTRVKKYSLVDKVIILWRELLPNECINPIGPSPPTVPCTRAHQDELRLFCSNRFVLEWTRKEYGWIDIIDTLGKQNCTPATEDFDDETHPCQCWLEYDRIRSCDVDDAGWPSTPVGTTLQLADHCTVLGQQNNFIVDTEPPRTILDIGEWNIFIEDYCSTSNRTNATNITMSSFNDVIYWDFPHQPDLCGTSFEEVNAQAEITNSSTMIFTLYNHLERMFRSMWSTTIKQYEIDVYGTIGFGANVKVNQMPITDVPQGPNIRQSAMISVLGVRQDNMQEVNAFQFQDIQAQMLVTIPTKGVFSRAVDPKLDVKFQHLAPKNHIRVGSEECSNFPCATPNNPTQIHTYDPPPQLLLATYNPQQQQGNPTYVMSNADFDPDAGPFTFNDWLNNTDASMFDPIKASGSIHRYYRKIDPATRRCDSSKFTPGGSQCSIMDFFLWETCPDSINMCLSPRTWSMVGTVVIPFGDIVEERLESCPDILVQQAGAAGANIVLTNSRLSRTITLIRELVSSNFLCRSTQEVDIQAGASTTELVTAVAGCGDRQVVIKANGTVCARKNITFADQTLTLADQNADIISQAKVDSAANRLSAVGQNMASIIGLFSIGLDPLDYTRQVVGPDIFDASDLPQVNIQDKLRKTLILITNTTNLLDNDDVNFLIQKSDQNIGAVTAILAAENIRTERINNLTVEAARLQNISAAQVENTTKLVDELEARGVILGASIDEVNNEIDDILNNPFHGFPGNPMACCGSVMNLLICGLMIFAVVIGVKVFGTAAMKQVSKSGGYTPTPNGDPMELRTIRESAPPITHTTTYTD